ncbi:hypothetical protein WA171_001755 [Blastocystis sp. BT1]
MASRNVLLASAGYDTTIRFWDISGGHTKRTLKYEDNPELKVKMPVNSITFSPDGTLLAACSVKSFKLYETESERQSPKFSNPEAHKASVNKIGFNREGKWIYTAGDDRCCKLWDIRTNVCTNSVESRGGINGCMLHPNQKEIVMADECGYVRVWDIVAGRFRVEMCPDDNVPLHAMTISHDGETLVACSKKGNVYVWKYSDSYIQPQFMFHAHDDFILACSISPNNKILATASADRSIKLWDAESFELSSKLIGHEKYVWDCCFSCDSKNLVSCKLGVDLFM